MGNVHRSRLPGLQHRKATVATMPPPLTVDDLYTTERHTMLRIATVMLGSVHEAEDVVHDAFSEVERRFDELERPGAYLRTCVVNGCRSRLRHQKVVDRYQRAEEAAARAASEVALPTHLIELREALDTLNERQRTVVVLRYFVDLPDEEIADIVGISPITVRTVTHRALKALRAELQPTEIADGPSGETS